MSKRVFIREYKTSITTNGTREWQATFNFGNHTLTNEETNRLVALAKKGDIEARNTLIEDNLRLVMSIARSFQFATYSNALNVSDLFDEGVVGIIFAIENYNTDGDTFGNYASAYIRREIVRFIASKGRMVRRPFNKQDADTYRHDSLDENVFGEDETTKGDMLSDTTDTADHTDTKSLAADLARVMESVLSKKEIAIVCKAFGIGETQTSDWEIAMQMGCTSERIRQIKVEALKKMQGCARALELLKKYL
jgi:RNA polymerase sigma factor (sigma-70 family)